MFRYLPINYYCEIRCELNRELAICSRWVSLKKPLKPINQVPKYVEMSTVTSQIKQSNKSNNTPNEVCLNVLHLFTQT